MCILVCCILGEKTNTKANVLEALVLALMCCLLSKYGNPQQIVCLDIHQCQAQSDKPSTAEWLHQWTR